MEFKVNYFSNLQLRPKRLYQNKDIDCLLREDKCSPIEKQFGDIMNKRDKPTLMHLYLDTGFFTAANIVPEHKHFFHPHISDNVYPDIKEYQTRMIIERSPMFVISIRRDYPHLEENYDLVKAEGHMLLYERKK